MQDIELPLGTGNPRHFAFVTGLTAARATADSLLVGVPGNSNASPRALLSYDHGDGVDSMPVSSPSPPPRFPPLGLAGGIVVFDVSSEGELTLNSHTTFSDEAAAKQRGVRRQACRWAERPRVAASASAL